MRPFTQQFEVFSPRWGHPDTYTLTMTTSGFTVEIGRNSAVCKMHADRDAEWVEHHYLHPLFAIFKNDNIQAPEAVPKALEWAWRQWQDHCSDEVLRAGLIELFSWVDTTARSKPKSDLWKPYF